MWRGDSEFVNDANIANKANMYVTQHQTDVVTLLPWRRSPADRDDIRQEGIYLQRQTNQWITRPSSGCICLATRLSWATRIYPPHLRELWPENACTTSSLPIALPNTQCCCQNNQQRCDRRTMAARHVRQGDQLCRLRLGARKRSNQQLQEYYVKHTQNVYVELVHSERVHP